jgi:hypothetical protein
MLLTESWLMLEKLPQIRSAVLFRAKRSTKTKSYDGTTDVVGDLPDAALKFCALLGAGHDCGYVRCTAASVLTGGQDPAERVIL